MKLTRKLENILVTGGAGFIGCNFIRSLLLKNYFSGRIINLDKLTYAGNPASLSDVDESDSGTYIFVKGDVCDMSLLKKIFSDYEIDTVVHFAAESHVDRSISGPADFINTNILGTFNLLEAAREFWGSGYEGNLFHHISTDEVFGSLGDDGFFTEQTAYDPRSPYSASKASADHLVSAYFHTYDLPVTMSNCSNNFGPYQFPEKLLPVMIEKMISGEKLPVYGDGKNIRDWIYVEDHNTAVWTIMQKGKTGETYNIGGENEWQNIRLVEYLCDIVAEKTLVKPESLKSLITYVKDRPGHDRRYAINCDKIREELGWTRSYSFEEALENTVDWYLSNRDWVESIKTGDYRNWMEVNYGDR